ncbi:MAG: hypothetical protein JNN30_15040 [Rhodanobacteraceae bacterium]|nr:hypothetical protein [Rhodanobacteraceae bacterium]
MPIATQSANWSTFDFTLTPQAKDVFDTVAPALFGAKYTPLAFSRQGAATVQLCFLCDADYTAPPVSSNLVLIYIHQPEADTPYPYRIVPVAP